MDQIYLNNYFDKIWRNLNFSDTLNQIHSGKNLIDKIDNESVIDIGCGKNMFKKYIPNLIGIDPAFPEADYQMTLEEYHKINVSLFDVAFCLGSINFGSKENIENQIKLVIDMLKPNSRIYWRCNPGLADHGNKDCETIDFYPWTFEEHIRLSDKFGFKLIDLRWDNNRIYAEWKRR